MNAMETPDGTARVIRKPSLTLSKGTMIECILETRVDTSVPGMASCVIPQNIYSMDGRVLLIEKAQRLLVSIRAQFKTVLSVFLCSGPS